MVPQEKKQYDLLVIGDLNFDYLGAIPSSPRPDEEVEVTGLEVCLGGSGANAAVVASRLGLSVDFYSAVGGDPGANQLIDLLAVSNVSGEHVKHVPGQTTGMVFGVIAPNGARNLFSFRGANLALVPADLPDAALARSRRVHLNGPEYQLALDVLQRSHRLGVPTSLDPGSILISDHPSDMAHLLQFTDILFVNEMEYASLIPRGSDEERASALHALGVEWVVVKLGPRGSMLYPAGKEPIAAPAYAIQAVDTTGSGDAFNAAFLYALRQNFELAEALRFGNAVGALVAQAVGATTGVPHSVQPVLDFMHQTPFSA